jgi:ribonuclease-3
VTERTKAAIAAVEGKIGYRFTDASLLTRALTHASAGTGAASTYERLEFLGDRVLALVVADMLLRDFPGASEGELARRLTALVRNESCAAVAVKLGLGEAIHLGTGEHQSGGRNKAAILGDVCEAVIGAIYQDGGLEPARTFVEQNWSERLTATTTLQDAKTALQEWAQGRGLAAPVYAIVNRSGPEHAPRFTVEARIAGLADASGEGGSRREAEQNAAAMMLIREGVWKAEHRG